MAKKRTTAKAKKTSAKTPAESKAPQRRRSPEDVQKGEGIIDDGTKRSIFGVLFIIAAIVFLLLAVMPSDAIVSGAVSKGLHLVFGIGCYIFPIIMFAIGITFFGKFRAERVSARVAIGFLVIFIALLGFIALFAPISSLGRENPDLLFTEIALVSYGGYIGSGIAWCGIVLLGKVITGVILAGIMLIGILIVGFSFTKAITAIRQSGQDFAQQHMGGPSSGFARVRQRPVGEISPEQQMALEQQEEYPDFDPDNTRIINGAGPKELNSNGDPLMSNASAKGNHAGRMQPESDSDMTRRLVPIVHEGMDGNPRSAQTQALTRKLGPIRDDSEQQEDESGMPSSKKPSRKAKKAVPVSSPTPQEGFNLPPMSLLNTSKSSKKKGASNLDAVAQSLQQVLENFGIFATVVDWIAGPTVTLFMIDLPAGVRVSRITALNDDIALALASPGVRIFAPVPHTNYVGIEVPNTERETVLLTDVLKDADEGPLQIAIGKDVEGNSIVSDLAKMPHLLIGGTTGSGKSVSINAMIMSILMRATPSEVRFILIDPKRVEFTPYNGIPHLYVPVVTEPKEAASALAWGVAEMERRLKIFSKVGARNINQYNAKAQAALANPSEDGSDEVEYEEMPYIVIVIDELADLMMNVGKEVELSISRIAQLARAAGIHLIVATQRPSANVVTGLIKANITNRMAFNVASSIDSRVILDSPGAESLIGLGDLLLSKPELSKPQRIQGCFVTEDEIMGVVDYIKDQSAPEYHNEILQTNVYSQGDTNPMGGTSSDYDPLIWEAADLVVSSGMGSTSNVQRRLKVGYARAGRIMDQLEEIGVVGNANGSKPREVLVDELELETLRAFEEKD